jgi:uncharacterized protein YecT (DUF1311 family)
LPIVLLASVLSHSQQRPDPCADLQSQAEMNQCSTLQYKIADASLNALYQRLMTALEKDLAEAQRAKDPDQIRYCETGLSDLKEAERAWLQYRDLHCKAAKRRFEGGSMSPAVWSACMKQVTEHRIAELKQAYENVEDSSTETH